MTWTEEEVLRAARDRLNQTLSVLRDLGAQVSGEVGDWTPILAVEDAFRTREFDETIRVDPACPRFILFGTQGHSTWPSGSPVASSGSQ